MPIDDITDEYNAAQETQHTADDVEDALAAEREYYHSIIDDPDVEMLGVIGIVNSDSPKPAVAGGVSDIRGLRENDGEGAGIMEAIASPAALAYALFNASANTLQQELPGSVAKDLTVGSLIGALMLLDQQDPMMVEATPDSFSDVFGEQEPSDTDTDDSGSDFVEIFLDEDDE